jgi:hypothetical protein
VSRQVREAMNPEHDDERELVAVRKSNVSLTGSIIKAIKAQLIEAEENHCYRQVYEAVYNCVHVLLKNPATQEAAVRLASALGMRLHSSDHIEISDIDFTANNELMLGETQELNDMVAYQLAKRAKPSTDHFDQLITMKLLACSLNDSSLNTGDVYMGNIYRQFFEALPQLKNRDEEAQRVYDMLDLTERIYLRRIVIRAEDLIDEQARLLNNPKDRYGNIIYDPQALIAIRTAMIGNEYHLPDLIKRKVDKLWARGIHDEKSGFHGDEIEDALMGNKGLVLTPDSNVWFRNCIIGDQVNVITSLLPYEGRRRDHGPPPLIDTWMRSPYEVDRDRVFREMEVPLDDTKRVVHCIPVLCINEQYRLSKCYAVSERNPWNFLGVNSNGKLVFLTYRSQGHFTVTETVQDWSYNNNPAGNLVHVTRFARLPGEDYNQGSSLRRQVGLVDKRGREIYKDTQINIGHCISRDYELIQAFSTFSGMPVGRPSIKFDPDEQNRSVANSMAYLSLSHNRVEVRWEYYLDAYSDSLALREFGKTQLEWNTDRADADSCTEVQIGILRTEKGMSLQRATDTVYRRPFMASIPLPLPEAVLDVVNGRQHDFVNQPELYTPQQAL